MSSIMRQGYETTAEAIAGGIAQYEKSKVVGFDVSAQDANLRHIAASEAMARSNAKSRKLMARLRNNIKSKPMSADEMSELIYPKRRSHVHSGNDTR